jgi:menaquinone-specific isochorismate synthase
MPMDKPDFIALAPAKLMARYRQQLAKVIGRHPMRPGRLYSITLPLPKLDLHLFTGTEAHWFYWGLPEQGCERVGIGKGLPLVFHGKERFRQLSRHFQQLRQAWDRHDPERIAIEPVIFTGFSFIPQGTAARAGFPDAMLFVPSLLLQNIGDLSAITFSAQAQDVPNHEQQLEDWMEALGALFEQSTCPAESGAAKPDLVRLQESPSVEEWNHCFNQFKQDCQAGPLKKVVLARRVRLRAKQRLIPTRLLARLKTLYPESVLFATGQAREALVSASPEYLLRLQGNDLSSDAVAGTLRRDASEVLDRQLGDQLMTDAKARHEHQLVVDDIQDSLAEISQQIHPTPPARLKRLRRLQHLHTRVNARLNPHIDLFDAAERLHPTAAVNGAPAVLASRWLQQHETLGRGWYSGSAGWVAASGDGELAVLIRTALIDGREAELIAGAGITRQSEANSEFAETELKIAAMLEALESI